MVLYAKQGMLKADRLYRRARAEFIDVFNDLAAQYNNLGTDDRKKCTDLKELLKIFYNEEDEDIVIAFKSTVKDLSDIKDPRWGHDDVYLEKQGYDVERVEQGKGQFKTFKQVFPLQVNDFKTDNEKFVDLVDKVKHVRKTLPSELTKTSIVQDIKNLLELALSALAVFPLYERCKREGGLKAGVKSFFESDIEQTLRKIEYKLDVVQERREQYQYAYNHGEAPPSLK